MNEELQMFDVWMKCNKLSVNIKKLIMLFSNRVRKKFHKIFFFAMAMKYLNKKTLQSF